MGSDSLRNGFKSDTQEFGGHSFTGNAFTIFKDFFGSENPWSQQLAPRSVLLDEIAKIGLKNKAQDVKVTVQCSLFEFYNGAIKEVTYGQQVAYENGEDGLAHEKVIKIEVKPGYSDKTILRLPGLGHRNYGTHSSDLVINFELIQPTGGFANEGENLVYSENVTLL